MNFINQVTRPTSQKEYRAGIYDYSAKELPVMPHIGSKIDFTN